MIWLADCAAWQQFQPSKERRASHIFLKNLFRQGTQYSAAACLCSVAASDLQ